MAKKLSVEHYLSKHHLETYFKDIIELLLECKGYGIKVNSELFMYDYFKSIQNGSNILFREFLYVVATPGNRRSFLKTFWKSFHYLHTESVLLNLKEYHTLMSLLCHDFDINMLKNTFKLILADDALDCLVTFNDFFYSFQLQFFYNEFSMKCKEIILRLFIECNSNLSADMKQDEITRTKECSAAEKVLASAFYNELINDMYSQSLSTFNRHIYPLVPQEIIKQIISEQKEISYYGFMKSLCQSDELIQTIGVVHSYKI